MNYFYRTLGLMRGCGALMCLLWLGALSVNALEHFVRSPQTCTNTIAQSPFTNWAIAATNIQYAADVASYGDTVWVSNGVYNTDSPRVCVGNPVYGMGAVYSVVLVSNSIVLKSVNGPSVTVIDAANGYRVITIVNSTIYDPGCNAVTTTVSGFTIRNGRAAAGWGGGIFYMHADTAVPYNNVVTNCILYNNYSQASGGAIGVGEGAQGSVYNCSMYSNSSAYGGAIRYSYCSASEIYNCSFWENISYNSYGGGAVACAATPLKIKNCLFYKNKNTASDGKGGGFSCWAGGSLDLQNCTFVGNTATNGGGGISIWSGLGANFSARNLIIYDNYSFSDYPNIYLEYNSYTNSFTNCCIATTNYVFPVAQGNITNAPLLAGTNADNYRLSAQSPCINTGTNQGWMTGAVDLDGNRRLDRLSGLVDMGAYEFIYKFTLFKVR